MERKIFVKLPFNIPSGGVKVANQLVNLFKEHNYESYIVLPSKIYIADWLLNPAPTMNVEKMEKLCTVNDIIIDNWTDKNSIIQTRRSKARTKIFYSQGCTFYKGGNLIGDEILKNNFGHTHFWAVSTDSFNYLKEKYQKVKNWYLVHPYLDFENGINITNKIKREDKILTFLRKGKSYISLAKLIYGKKIEFDNIDGFTERQAYKLYASHKFFLSTAIGVSPTKQFIINTIRLLKHRDIKHSISVVSPAGCREGFPLPPAEAAMCGSIVIGFAMGGGLEWMTPSTCFLSEDRSYYSIMAKIKEALSSSDMQLNAIRENAFKAVSRFNKENTWRQIKEFLSEA